MNPEELKTISVNGTELGYSVRETGADRPALVFVHGYGMRSTGGHYDELLEELAEHYAVHALDLRGHGASAGSVHGWSHAALADDVAAFSCALGLDRPVLVGHSFGAVIALLAEIRDPGAFSALCLLAPGPADPRRDPVDALEFLVEHGQNREALRPVFEGMFLRRPGGMLDQALDAVVLVDPAVHRAQSEQNATVSIADQLSEVAAPVLLVRGGHDVVVSPARQHDLAIALPHVQEMVLPGEGHMLPHEWAAGTASEIHAFLDTTTAPRDRGAVTHPLHDSVIVERNVRVTMSDGVDLAATVYRPDDGGRFPVVMCLTSYGKDLGPDRYTTLPNIAAAGMAVGTMHISDVTTWEGPDPSFWVPHGYVVVVIDARGFHASGGEAGIYSHQDAQDYAEMIEWAGTQAWSTGSVGLNGVSYLAITQWMVAARTKPPHLKAITPWEGSTDLLRDATHHGGIPETRFLKGWLSGSLARGAGPDIVSRGPALMAQAEQEPFTLESIDVPTLTCASWSDHGLHSRGSIEGFERISSDDKWLYTHGRNKWEVYYSADALEWQRSFFDHFLKGDDNGFERRPRVRLETRRSYDDFLARSEQAWPPEGTTFTPHYLDLARGTLSLEPPQGDQSLSYEATSAETVEFALTFDRRTEVTGPMVLSLWVSALDTDDLDLFVAVRKIDREDREVYFPGKDGYRHGVVALGWLRVSQRALDEDHTTPRRPYLSHDTPEKVRPGEVVHVEIEILPSSTLFEAGESLRLDVSGRDIVGHSRFAHDDTVNRGRHELHTGPARAAHVLVPVQ